MTIKWNKVTWYSKLFALILFIGLPVLGFYLGVQYQTMREVGFEGRRILNELKTNSQQLTTSTSTWKTYRNEKYGFEFQYPLDWEIGDNSNNVTIFKATSAPYYGITIYIYPNEGRLSARKYATTPNPDAIYPPKFKEGLDTNVGSYPAYERRGVFAFLESLDEIYLSRNNMMFVFSFPSSENTESVLNPEKNNQIARQVISTFKFTK